MNKNKELSRRQGVNQEHGIFSLIILVIFFVALTTLVAFTVYTLYDINQTLTQSLNHSHLTVTDYSTEL